MVTTSLAPQSGGTAGLLSLAQWFQCSKPPLSNKLIHGQTFLGMT